MMEIVSKPYSKTRKRQPNKNPFSVEGDLLLKLYELLQGERDLVRVYSHALQSEICFVNPALLDEKAIPADCPVYTTRELSFVLSLTEEEFRRYHYFKTRLID